MDSMWMTMGARTGMPLRPGYHWVRRRGMWREERLPTEAEAAALRDAVTLQMERGDEWAETVALDALHDRYATFQDRYDGPEGLCACCGNPLETIGALLAGRCSPCVVARRDPLPTDDSTPDA